MILRVVCFCSLLIHFEKGLSSSKREITRFTTSRVRIPIIHVSKLQDGLEHIDLPPPAIMKPCELWTGKQAINVMLRPNRRDLGLRGFRRLNQSVEIWCFDTLILWMLNTVDRFRWIFGKYTICLQLALHLHSLKISSVFVHNIPHLCTCFYQDVDQPDPKSFAGCFWSCSENHFETI